MSHQKDPIAAILVQRDRQRQLCRQLEDVADRLPTVPDGNAVAELFLVLKRELPVFNRDEELLFSLVGHHWSGPSDFKELLSLICAQHDTHSAFADEFDEVFRCQDAHEMGCGYMLRYIFETLQSHLDWEDAIVIPFAISALSDSERSELAMIMAAKRLDQSRR